MAQDTTMNQLDGTGRKQGLWRVYDESGNLRYEGSFMNDMPVGEFLYYYPNGKLKAISQMIDGGRRSRTRIFHENGRLLAEGNYLDKEKDSTWNYYSDFDGVLISTEYYAGGELDSLLVNYYADGRPAEEIHYAHGKKNGTWIKYFTDGKINLKANYTDGLLQGVMIVYFQNGIPEITGMYHNDFKDGLWMFFNDRGGVLKKETYKMGRIIKTEEF